MLSAFEAALLDRHLAGCPECRSFATSADEQTRLLRGAVLEQAPQRVLMPSAARAQVGLPRRAAGVLSACLIAGAAAAALVWPGARTGNSGQPLSLSGRTGAPVPVVVAARPSMANVNVVVPRIRMRPASIADGPVHGYFSEPV